jgi:hypothetical protein
LSVAGAVVQIHQWKSRNLFVAVQRLEIPSPKEARKWNVDMISIYCPGHRVAGHESDKALHSPCKEDSP